MSKKFRKLRILWCGEASFLNTGYSIYAKELLTRLYKTGKYKIAEMACYAGHDNAQIYDIPWRVYPTMPINQQEADAYNANPNYQFGEWRFDDICLDFRPDVVIDIRDWWMMEFQSRAAFRKFYKWLIMPTVDSSPQQEQYIDTYLDADAVFTYSEYGQEVLEKDSNGQIKVTGIASPGADFENLQPVVNKKQHRESAGFMDNINIVGTVMRNQRRKLYPNLIESFGRMLQNNPELQKNTYLYLHTSYPDLGWDLPYFIKKYGMGHNTLVTYKCKNCNNFFPSFYQDAKIPCSKCGLPEAVLPNTSFGVTTKELGQIINWFDLYVQYSVCEGFGMPQVEAGACGIPAITVDYSAMSSVGRKLKSEFVNPKYFFWDSPTHSKRAIPDDEELIEKILKFLKLPQSMRSKKGMDAYVGVKKHYTWDKAAKAWQEYLDTIEPISHEETWSSKIKLHTPNEEVPQNLSVEEFVNWGITNIWGRPDKTDSYLALRLCRDLNYGKRVSTSESLYHDENSYINNQQNFNPFTHREAVQKLKNMCEYYNMWERRRAELEMSDDWDSVNRPLFLSYVKPDYNNTNAAD